MKKKLIRMLFFALVLFGTTAASAQIYVRIRPVLPVVVRTPQPARGQVWVNEDWQPTNGHYNYNGGRWVKPPRQGDKWRNGYWRHNGRRGDTWVPGKWNRRRH